MKNKTSVHKITLDENEFVIDSATLTPASEIGRTSQVTEADAFDELCDSPEKQDQIVDVCLFRVFNHVCPLTQT